ncbi:hypothetical protein CVT24_004220 [Panaeolus cyanescens]|uniref:C2H2-type domain-containing protein n=1 Tax=Panaeolus cyanescens TaxID=181874 RepID=A0A409YSW8_9AGAR|nr:hypothetical protein CVT24_004220 [Panaeolus cyanescens]
MPDNYDHLLVTNSYEPFDASDDDVKIWNWMNTTPDAFDQASSSIRENHFLFDAQSVGPLFMDTFPIPSDSSLPSQYTYDTTWCHIYNPGNTWLPSSLSLADGCVHTEVPFPLATLPPSAQPPVYAPFSLEVCQTSAANVSDKNHGFIPGANSRIPQAQQAPLRLPDRRRHRRRLDRQKQKERSKDPRFLDVLECISAIMADVRVPSTSDGHLDPAFAVEMENELQTYIDSLSDPELKEWMSLRRYDVGTLMGKEVASRKRKAKSMGPRSQLFYCLWCHQTMTTKNNLYTHVRSHLDFPLSFCDSCKFSSVTARLPARHSCRKRLGA